MKKKNRDVEIYSKFQKKIKFILYDKKIQFLLKNHYDHHGKILTYVLYFIIQYSDNKQILKKIKNTKNKWISLFSKFYENESIKKVFNKIINHSLLFDDITNEFNEIKLFSNFLISFIKKHHIKLLIPNDKVNNIIFLSLCYLTYNFAWCQIPKTISEIIEDTDYDKKYIITLNNVNLFKEAKNAILSNCGNKVSNLIAFLFSCSNPLFK